MFGHQCPNYYDFMGGKKNPIVFFLGFGFVVGFGWLWGFFLCVCFEGFLCLFGFIVCFFLVIMMTAYLMCSGNKKPSLAGGSVL